MPIKMTKELPTEDGFYYFSAKIGCTPVIGEIRWGGKFFVGCEYWPRRTDGGYWAKVDKDQFEFED